MTYSEYLELEAVFGTTACCGAFDSSMIYLQYRLTYFSGTVTYAERLALIRDTEQYFLNALEERYIAPRD